MKFFCFLFMLFCLNTFANNFEINKEHSKVEFSVGFMKVSEVVGKFKDYNGNFEFNTDSKILKNANFIIKSNSIDTNDPKRDKHLVGHEFFAASSYPEISFKTTNQSQLAENKTKNVYGELKIKDKIVPVVLETVYKGKIIDPWGKENHFFNISGKVDRKKFNMTWNKYLDDGSLVLNDEVKINISVQAQLKGGKTAFSNFMIPSTKGIDERNLFHKGKIKKITTPTGN